MVRKNKIKPKAKPKPLKTGPIVVSRKDKPFNKQMEELTYDNHVWKEKMAEIDGVNQNVVDPKTDDIWFTCKTCGLESLDPETVTKTPCVVEVDK